MAHAPAHARPPDVDLDDTRSLLQTAQRAFPLLTIQTEQHHPGACYIGRIASLDDDAVLLHLVSPAGEWDEEDEYPYESITRIGFGGRYEAALALAAGPDPAGATPSEGREHVASAAHPAAVDRHDLARHVRAGGRAEVDERAARSSGVPQRPAGMRSSISL